MYSWKIIHGKHKRIALQSLIKLWRLVIVAFITIAYAFLYLPALMDGFVFTLYGTVLTYGYADYYSPHT